MAQSNTTLSLPSFSIIVETENLSTADLDGLLECLNSLERQEISPASANEVLLINSGDVPKDLIDQVCKKYPWVSVHHVEQELNYYYSKMHGVKLVTGDIVIFADSDCCYVQGWLKGMLTPFAQSETTHVVGGETAMAIKGPYSLAMALTYIFPPFTGQQKLYAWPGYFCNNVAFRREFLLQHPIPSKLPIYRGNCSTHSSTLRSLGYTIWRQPEARATHAPPENLFHFFWRFLLMGSDDWRMGRQSQDGIAANNQPSSMELLMNRFRKAVRRGRIVFRDNPNHLVHLPLALPIAIASLSLICIGFVLEIFKPNYILETFERLEDQQTAPAPKQAQATVLTGQ